MMYIHEPSLEKLKKHIDSFYDFALTRSENLAGDRPAVDDMHVAGDVTRVI